MIAKSALKLFLLGVVGTIVFSRTAVGQIVAPPDRRAEPAVANPAPLYPEILRRSGASGIVRVQVVVDTNGRSYRATRGILVADHPVVAQSVNSVLDRWRFVPAFAGGRPVSDTLEIAMRFGGIEGFSLELFDSLPFVRKLITPGSWEYAIGHAPSDASAVLPDSSSQFAIAMIMLDTVLAQITSTEEKRPDRVACVSVGLSENASQLTMENMAQLTRQGVAVTDARRCPRTFHSQPFVLAESMGKTPSNSPEQDPFALHVKQLQAVSDHEVSGLVVMSEAKRVSESSCVATGDSAVQNGWRVRCVTTRVILPTIVHR